MNEQYKLQNSSLDAKSKDMQAEILALEKSNRQIEDVHSQQISHVEKLKKSLEAALQEKSNLKNLFDRQLEDVHSQQESRVEKLEKSIKASVHEKSNLKKLFKDEISKEKQLHEESKLRISALETKCSALLEKTNVLDADNKKLETVNKAYEVYNSRGNCGKFLFLRRGFE